MKTVAVIMTGGKSKRMGRDKAKLYFGGQPLLAHQIQKWANVFDDLIISVDQKERFPWITYRMVEDHRQGLGPMAGLEAVMLDVPADRYFITAVDMPFASPELALQINESCGKADVGIIRRRSGRVEPMFALYGRECLCHIVQALDKKMYSFTRGLLPFVHVREFPEQELLQYDLERILLNVNTVEDWISMKCLSIDLRE